MRIALVLGTILLLFVPITMADADGVFHFPVSVTVTISVTGVVPLRAGDFVIDDTFTLHGLGDASAIIGQPPATALIRSDEVGFQAVDGSVHASGFVRLADFGDFGVAGANLELSTPAYSLFGADESAFLHDFFVFVNPELQQAFFGAASLHPLVRVGEETAALVGAASFEGTGVPEPSATMMLLTLGGVSVTALGCWLSRDRSRYVAEAHRK